MGEHRPDDAAGGAEKSGPADSGSWTDPRFPGVMCRRAAAEDMDALLGLRSSMEDDYLPHALANWIEDDPGGVYAYYFDGTLCGLSSIHIPRPGEAWLRGKRIDADKAGRGLGTATAWFEVYEAGRLGAGAARLMSDVSNAPVHHMIGNKLEFHAAGVWWVANPAGPARRLLGWAAAGGGAPGAGGTSDEGTVIPSEAVDAMAGAADPTPGTGGGRGGGAVPAPGTGDPGPAGTVGGAVAAAPVAPEELADGLPPDLARLLEGIHRDADQSTAVKGPAPGWGPWGLVADPRYPWTLTTFHMEDLRRAAAAGALIAAGEPGRRSGIMWMHGLRRDDGSTAPPGPGKEYTYIRLFAAASPRAAAALARAALNRAGDGELIVSLPVTQARQLLGGRDGAGGLNPGERDAPVSAADYVGRPPGADGEEPFADLPGRAYVVYEKPTDDAGSDG